MRRLGQLKGFRRVLQSLPRVFVSAQMVALAMLLHRHPVSVRGQLVKLGGPLMRIVHSC